MVTRQRIVRSRREYNQWVANQTLEDYALRFTAKRARKWSALRVANTALGGISFLALEAIGGTITIGYGFSNAVAAIVLVGLLIFAAGVPISYYAARDGVDIDLLTRGAGFGYIGSTITSLIYATFTFIFFAIEAAILASVLQSCFSIPLGIGYIICSRHHLHQPGATLVAADLDHHAGDAVYRHRTGRAPQLRLMAGFSRQCSGRRRIASPDSFRRRRIRGVRPDRANR